MVRLPSRDRRLVGIVLSVALALTIWASHVPGLSPDGQKALALTLFAVVWWIFGVTHPAFTTFLLLPAYLVFGLAGPESVFRLWTTPLMWLMIGAFLIAAAVTKSGLATRVAYLFMIRFARSYRSIVVLAYVLGFVLSLLIPQPFPRTLLIMAIVSAILQRAGANKQDTASLGFAVFASATATSTILLTGDGLLNAAAVAISGAPVGWFDWLVYMAVPGIAASAFTMGLLFVVFKQTGPLEIDRSALLAEQQKLGGLRRDEVVTIAWVALALALWATDALHGIDPAWVALAVVVGLSLPYVGEILEPRDLSAGVNWSIIVFAVGALAIGTVGRETGMADWLAQQVLPASPPSNPFAFAALVGGATMLLHMCIGSSLASMSVIAPPIVQYAGAAGWNPIVPALLVYTAVTIHFLFPFQQMLILLGSGEVGKYGTRETLRYGIPLTIVALVVMVLVEVSWWTLVGLI